MKLPKGIPNFPDLRSFTLLGACRCGGSSAQDDIHFANCPHVQHSRAGVVLMWR